MDKYLIFTLFNMRESLVMPDSKTFVPKCYCYSQHTGQWYKLIRKIHSMSTKTTFVWDKWEKTQVPQEHRTTALIWGKS